MRHAVISRLLRSVSRLSGLALASLLSVPPARAALPPPGDIFARSAFERVHTPSPFVDDRGAAKTPSADGAWLPGFGRGGSDCYVYAVAAFNGLLVAAGSFEAIGGISAHHIAAWNGTSWSPLGDGIAGGNIYALTVQGNTLVAAGTFTSAGGVPVNRIARWNGATWDSIGSGFNYDVYALTTVNGALVAGGAFTGSGHTRLGGIAVWTGSAWRPLGAVTLSGATVYALTNVGGAVIAGGYFQQIGGVAAQHIARWQRGTWYPMGTGVTSMSVYPPPVTALAQAGGRVYVGGTFTAVNSVAADNVAVWDGTAWSALDGGTDGAVFALTPYDAGVVAGGNFTHAGSTAASFIARWDGGAWTPLDGGTSGVVLALGVRSSATLVAGGAFDQAGGLVANNIAQWNGSSWDRVSPPGQGVNAVAYAEALYQGDVVATGDFTRAGDAAVQHVAAWNGATWRALGLGVAGTGFAALEWNGTLIVGGDFGEAGGVSVSNIAAWNGTSWSPLGAGLNGRVRALATYQDDLVAGGNFTTAGGVPAPGIARWNGTTWSAFGDGVSGEVLALVVYNGQLLAGGQFHQAMGADSVNDVARWDGATWRRLGPVERETLDFSFVAALTVYQNELIAGGAFGSLGAVPAQNVARWDGASWHPLGGGVAGCISTCLATVQAFGVYNGALFAGGTFTLAGGAASPGIARWNGTDWSSLGAGIGGCNYNPPGFYVGTAIGVWALLPRVDGLYAGGAFSVTGGVDAGNIAVWSETPVAIEDAETVSSARLARLWSVRPNPSSEPLVVRYSLAVRTLVDLRVLDAQGRTLRVLTRTVQSAGDHRLMWDGRDARGRAVPSSTYFLRLTAGSLIYTERVLRLH
jgi:hypothetical protein